MGFSFDTNNYVTDGFDNGYEELEIEVDFDYEPYEPMTRHYPGAPEAVIINAIYVVTDEGLSEICLIPNRVVEEQLENDILNEIHEAKAEAEVDRAYGYLMEGY